MLLLIVKGSREAAEAAADSRLVPFIFKGTNARIGKSYLNIETWLEVPSNQFSKIYDWFGEASEPPYHDGTLLFFTERTDR